MTKVHRPGIISHRGLCRPRPDADRIGENTLEAFSEGIDALGGLGFPRAIEFDIRRCRDGALVVMHDETLDRTTNGHGDVREHACADLVRLDAGRGRSIPLLTDVLDRFGGTPEVHFCIELKERGLAAEIRELVLGRNLGGRTIVSTFDDDDADAEDRHAERYPRWDELALVQPEIPIALLTTAKKVAERGEIWLVEQAQARGAAAVDVEDLAATGPLVSKAHAAGLRVSAWTVNTREEYERLTQIGVDRVFCDNPYFLAR